MKATKILSVEDTQGNIFKIGDKVTHSGAPGEIATIKAFYWDAIYGEIQAHTTKGSAGVDYLSPYLNLGFKKQI